MKIRLFIIVPARSGSKGLQNKNIRALGEYPLLVWTARAIARASLDHSLAILSTDSDTYGDIGRETGLLVPFKRSADCSSDTASAIQVIEHALIWFKSHYQYLPELVMWLQPTSPFRTETDIRRALICLDAEQADAVIGCKEIHRDLTTLFRCEDGFLTALDKTKPTQTSRQQCQPLLTPNGAMYLCKTEYLLENRSFYPPKTVPLVMNAIQSLDIDTEEDWAIAEAFIHQGLV